MLHGAERQLRNVWGDWEGGEESHCGLRWFQRKGTGTFERPLEHLQQPGSRGRPREQSLSPRWASALSR